MRMNHYGIGVRIDGHDVAPWIIEGGTIDYGRTSVFEQPTAPTAVLTMFTREGWEGNPRAWFDYGVGAWGDPSGFETDHDTQDTYYGTPTKIYIGAPVWISATTKSGFLPDHDTQDTYLGAEHRRFTGKVQSIEWDYYRVSITAAADLEAWSRVGIMAHPLPAIEAQTDVDRAATLADYAQSPTTLHIEGDTYAGVIGIPDDAYPICLLPALQQLAEDTDGLLYVDKEGKVTFRTGMWTPPAPYEIPPEIVDRESLSMNLELGDLENVIYVEYGEPDEFGEKQTVSATDPDSVTRYGTRTGFYTTQLESGSSAASSHAYNLLGKRRPQWQMPDLDIPMHVCTDAQVEEVCALEIGYRVTVTGLPAGAPVTAVV